MFKNIFLNSIACTSILLLASSLSANNKASTDQFDQLLNAVVRIDVWERSIDRGYEQVTRSQGSGVIMTPEGHIITNAHVASPNAQRIEITLANKQRVPGHFVGWDHWTDLSVLQLDMETIQQRAIEFNSAEFLDSKKLKLGDDLYAVGTPYGLNRTLTKGILSNEDRFLEGRNNQQGYETGFFNTWLQTDSAINPGNSGGPLVNAQGYVVGINSQVVEGTTLGFAIPSSVIIPILDEIKTDGAVTRSYIGVTLSPLQDFFDEYKLDPMGALIANIDTGSPADRSDLLPGDIILSINDKPIDGYFPETIPGIMNFIASFPVGAELELAVLRNKEFLIADLVTEKLESRVGQKEIFPEWGITLEKISNTVAREQYLKNTNGLKVIGLQSAFPAHKAGLQVGDLVFSANEIPIESIQTFMDIYKQHSQQKEPVFIEILRQGTRAYAVIE